MDIFESIDEENSLIQKFDSLADFHLRNPLKEIENEMKYLGTVDKGDLVRLPVRKRESLEEAKKIVSSFRAGDHTELLWNHSWMDGVVKTRIEEEIVEDTLMRLTLESRFEKFLNLREMIRVSKNVKHLITESEEFIKMFSVQDMLTVMNCLSSRRPVLDRYERMRTGNAVKLSGTNYVIVLTSNYMILCDKENSAKGRLYEGDWVRCASDVYTERYLIQLSVTLGNVMNPFHYPTKCYMNELFQWGDKVLKTFGNYGYKLLKVFEGLCTGWIMKLGDDQSVDNTLFYNNTKRDILSDDIRFLVHVMELEAILSKGESIHWISQAYGLHRIWGHPVTKASEGMEKVIKIGRKDITLSDRSPFVLGRHFKKMFVTGYVRKYKCFPAIVYSGEEKSIQDKLDINDQSLLTGTELSDEDWDNITLGNCFQIPETFNLSMIVADKSVSPSKSELIKNIKSRKTVMNSELRRGVLRWLNDQSIDPRQFLSDINAGAFPDDHKIIGLTPKERELNPIPRMFALMSHLMRVYVVITESMLSEHVLPIFPHITMTDTLLDLIKKIYGSAADQKRNQDMSKGIGKRTICMSLDFEKWNGHMRKESTFHVFESLGSLFGLPNLYNATYDIFSESYVYLADGSYVPKILKGNLIIEEPYSFTRHKGGMEGLRQKGWTLFTVVGLDLVCSRHNCQYKIMGMGDNQVLMLTYYTYSVDKNGKITDIGSREIEQKHKNLFLDLLDLFGELGLPLKPLETWSSECLFLYGKYPVWKGMPLTMDLKRLMRIFPYSNMDIMTVENMLNTVSGSAVAAAQASPCIATSYFVGLIMIHYSIRMLLRFHPLIAVGLRKALNDSVKRISRDKSKKSLYWELRTKTEGIMYFDLDYTGFDDRTLSITMGMIPRTLGGYLTFNCTSVTMRGFPDPLSRDLYYLNQIDCGNPESEVGNIAGNWKSVIYMPETNLRMLLEDILSVNHLNPVTPMSGVRQSVQKYLTGSRTIKNKEFKEMVSVCSDDMKDILAEELCSGEVLHLRLLHDIYDSTILGYVDSIISKVTKTATIQRLAVMASRVDISQYLIDTEVNYYKFFLWRCSQRGKTWAGNCPTEYAKSIRSEGWKRVLKGITVAYPAAFMEESSCYSNDKEVCNCDDGYISAHISDLSTSSEIWNNSTGSGLPYLGSMTKEKVTVQTGSKIYSSEPLVKRPVNLLRTINWFVPPESITADVIRKCLKAVTNVDPNQFTGIKEGTSGAEEHRYKDSSLSHGALTTSNYLYSTRFHISTDNFTRYSKGAENYDLHFQSVLCLLTECTNQKVFYADSIWANYKRCSHFKQICYKCISPLDENFVDIESNRAGEFIPSKPANKYLYVDEGRISYIEEKRRFLNLTQKEISEMEYNRLSPDFKYWWLVDIMSDEVVKSIRTGKTDEGIQETVDLHGGKIFGRTAYLKINPVDLFNMVAKKILILAEIDSLGKSEFLGVKREARTERARNIISNAPLGCFVGLALCYSWLESRDMMTRITWIWKTDDDPPSLGGACVSAKRSLYKRVGDLIFSAKRKTHMIAEEVVNNDLCYKMILISKISYYRDYCKECYRTLCYEKIVQITAQASDIECSQGHRIFERYDLKMIVSRATVDRIKKDAANKLEGNKMEDTIGREQSKLKPTDIMNVIRIASSRTLRRKLEVIDRECAKIDCRYGKKFNPVRPYNPGDCTMTRTIPTSSAYKYYEILSYLAKYFKHREGIFLIGDGSGGTSELVERMFHNSKLKVSTLLDCERIIPQTMPHLFKGPERYLDKYTMVNKINDITHPRWLSSWESELEDFQILISDVELTGDRFEDRLTMWKNVMSIRNWKLCVIKDYIYSKLELYDRMNLILQCTDEYELISSYHGQKKLPEVWWVLKNSRIPEGYREDRLVVYHNSVMEDVWNNLVEQMSSKMGGTEGVILKYEQSLLTKKHYKFMDNLMKMKCNIPDIGFIFPRDGSYTHVLGILQSGARPKSVYLSRKSTGEKKLYRSDNNKLKEVLFLLGVSMLADACERAKLVNDYENWELLYKRMKESTHWMPYLKRVRDNQEPGGFSPDLVGTCCKFMKENKLQFKKYENKIQFGRNLKSFGKQRKSRETSNKEEILHYPIARNMIIRATKNIGERQQQYS